MDAFIVVIILVLNYSTVIGYFNTNTSSPESSNKENIDEILVSFNLVVRSSNLTKSSHYNTYQHKLYRLIKFLKEERGKNLYWVDIYDKISAKKLAKYSKSWGFKVY